MSGTFDPRKEAHLLSAYVDGELDAADAARVEAHLAVDSQSRHEVAQLRRLTELTGALRLQEPPAEAWEDFWRSAYNRGERSLGWLILGLAVLVLGGWGVTLLLRELFGAEGLPAIVKGAVIGVCAGLGLLLVSVVRERVHKRRRTRYKDVVR